MKSGTGLVLVNTIENNRYRYTNCDYSRFKLVQKIQNLIVQSSTRDFLRIVKHKQLPNWPITHADILNSEYIWGTNLGSPKGDTTRWKREHFVMPHTDIPQEIMQKYREVTIAMYMIHVNRNSFLVTNSRNLHFITAEAIPNIWVEVLKGAIHRVSKIYCSRGFNIMTSHIDWQFYPVRGNLADIKIHLNLGYPYDNLSEI